MHPEDEELQWINKDLEFLNDYDLQSIDLTAFPLNQNDGSIYDSGGRFLGYAAETATGTSDGITTHITGVEGQSFRNEQRTRAVIPDNVQAHISSYYSMVSSSESSAFTDFMELDLSTSKSSDVNGTKINFDLEFEPKPPIDNPYNNTQAEHNMNRYSVSANIELDLTSSLQNGEVNHNVDVQMVFTNAEEPVTRARGSSVTNGGIITEQPDIFSTTMTTMGQNSLQQQLQALFNTTTAASFHPFQELAKFILFTKLPLSVDFFEHEPTGPVDVTFSSGSFTFTLTCPDHYNHALWIHNFERLKREMGSSFPTVISANSKRIAQVFGLLAFDSGCEIIDVVPETGNLLNCHHLHDEHQVLNNDIIPNYNYFDMNYGNFTTNHINVFSTTREDFSGKPDVICSDPANIDLTVSIGSNVNSVDNTISEMKPAKIAKSNKPTPKGSVPPVLYSQSHYDRVSQYTIKYFQYCTDLGIPPMSIPTTFQTISPQNGHEEDTLVSYKASHYYVLPPKEWMFHFLKYTIPNNVTDPEIIYATFGVVKDGGEWQYYQNVYDQVQFSVSRTSLPFRYLNMPANFYEPAIIRERRVDGGKDDESHRNERALRYTKGKGKDDKSYIIEAMCPYCSLINVEDVNPTDKYFFSRNNSEYLHHVSKHHGVFSDGTEHPLPTVVKNFKTGKLSAYCNECDMLIKIKDFNTRTGKPFDEFLSYFRHVIDHPGHSKNDGGIPRKEKKARIVAATGKTDMLYEFDSDVPC